MKSLGSNSNSNSSSSKKEEDDGVDDIDLARVSLSLQEFQLAKTYADRALRSNLLSFLERTRADQILAIAHVHTAASDWYAVLQLGNHHHNILTPDSLSFNHRRLAHLLDPDLNPFAYASSGSKLVSEAYSVLSDPQKKSLYDAQIRSASKSTFWTVCRSCFHVHEYQTMHEGKRLRCQMCKEAFVAAELPVEPPIVEGADMYYCTWGFFPLGFPGGYSFHSAPPKRAQEEMETPPAKRRQRQTARKTVRAVDFSTKLKSYHDEDDGEEVHG